MKVKDVPVGSIFNIENTPAYPKLKLEKSYIDMRDRIMGRPEITDEKDAYLMEVSDLCKEFDETPADITNWVEEFKRSINN